MICIEQSMQLSFMIYNASNIHTKQNENRGQVEHIMKVKRLLFFIEAYTFNSALYRVKCK